MSTQKNSKSNKWSVIRREGNFADPNPETKDKADNKKTDANEKDQKPAEAKTWQEFFDKQSDGVKKLYNDHHTALQNSVKATRDERDAFEKQIKELLPEAEKGSEFEKNLTEALEKLTKETKRANFFEAGIKPEIGCTNLSLAFLLTETKDLYKKDGSPDWDAIKKEFPEGFASKASDQKKNNSSFSETDVKDQNVLTKEVIEKMTPEEVNKHWKDGSIQEFLKTQQK